LCSNRLSYIAREENAQNDTEYTSTPQGAAGWP
jgi:hypothetical protein